MKKILSVGLFLFAFGACKKEDKVIPVRERFTAHAWRVTENYRNGVLLTTDACVKDNKNEFRADSVLFVSIESLKCHPAEIDQSLIWYLSSDSKFLTIISGVNFDTLIYDINSISADKMDIQVQIGDTMQRSVLVPF